MDIISSFQRLPLFTRTWLGLTLVITAAVTLDVIHTDQVVLDWHRIIPYNIFLNSDINNNHRNYQHQHHYHHISGNNNIIELWRLLTSFCYVGKLDKFNPLFLLFTIYLHSHGYEKNPFPAGSGSRTADTLFAALFCTFCLLCTQPIPGYFGTTYALYPIMTQNLAGALLYLWSKRNPRTMIQLNFIPMEGRYLPFAHIGASLFMKNRLHELLHGFLIGHIYYFLIEVAPVLMGGKRILSTPRLLVQLIGEDVENMIQQDNHEIENNININTDAMYRDRDGATQAHLAAKLGNLPQLRQISNTNVGLLNAPDRNGWKPVHEAVRGAHVQIVEYLIIEQMLDVHETTNNGKSPLLLAKEFHGEHHPMTRLILQIIATEDNNNNNDDDDDDSNDDVDS